MEKRRRSSQVGLLFGCSALHGKDNAISDVERGDGAFVHFIFPWFQYLLTIRNKPLAMLLLVSVCPIFPFHLIGIPLPHPLRFSCLPDFRWGLYSAAIMTACLQQSAEKTVFIAVSVLYGCLLLFRLHLFVVLFIVALICFVSSVPLPGDDVLCWLLPFFLSVSFCLLSLFSPTVFVPVWFGLVPSIL